MGTQTRWLFVFSLVAAGACSDTSGCSTTDLPGGALPADQTLEGGAQIRVTPQGFSKLTSVVPGLINGLLANGICLPQGSIAGASYCYNNDGSCVDGCQVDLQLNETTFSASPPSTLTIRLKIDLDTTIPVDPPSWCFNCETCLIDAYTSKTNPSDDITGYADIAIRTNATSGELEVEVVALRNVNLDGVVLDGYSGSFCDATAWFADGFKNNFASTIANYIRPRLNNMIQDQLPDPLGIEGVVDVGPLLAGISPGSQGAIEARIMPGGYATLTTTGGSGLTLGVITGINSDEEPLTRAAADDSEPALCVPPMLPPSFGSAPYGLALTSRNTFVLPAAAAFSGAPDPVGSDLAVGISETALDLIGHHAVTSGTMCLGIGTALVPQLNVGTFGILVPSVAELASDDGHDPVLIVTRPQKAIDFSIGDNTDASPAVTIHLRDFELDVYPFLYERYTRAFTMSATIDIGVNVTFEKPAGGPWQVKPALVGLAASSVTVKVLNSQFLAESATNLESALPSVFDLLFSQLALPTIDLPTFAGFEINDPTIEKATSASGDFLAIYANLGVSTMMRQLATNNRFLAEAVDQISSTVGPARRSESGPLHLGPAGPPSTGTARLRTVATPKAEDIRAALANTGGALPSVTIDVDRIDARFRELEWSWRLGNGMWRPYKTASELVIADRALVWQGAYEIGLKSRVKGQPATTSEETRIPVVIDSVGPHVVTAKTGWDDDDYVVRGWDVVGGDAIRIAFGTPGEDAPSTEWQSGAAATLSRMQAAGLANAGELTVFLEDAQGNRTVATVAPFHGQAGASGCACDVGRGAPASSIVLALLTMLGLRRRRRRATAA